MTEKRFRISQGYNDKFCHDWEKNKLLNFRQTVDLLNELAEENQQQKTFLKALREELQLADRDNTALEKENKELKKQVDEMINIFNDSGLDYHISDELEEILND